MLKDDLISNGIVIDGHFQLTNGNHSNMYINKNLITTVPHLFEDIIYSFYEISKSYDFDVITGPATAGAIMAAPLAHQLSLPMVYPEKTPEGNMVFKRGYDRYLKGKRVLIVEDIITSGKSVLSTIGAIQSCGGTPIVTLCIWMRRPLARTVLKKFAVDYLIKDRVMDWAPEKCPMCKDGYKLIDPKR